MDFSFGGNFDQNLKGEDSEDQRVEGMENGFVAGCEILVGLNSNGYAREKDCEKDEPLKRFLLSAMVEQNEVIGWVEFVFEGVEPQVVA